MLKIKSTKSDETKNFSAIVYGQAGIGKTRLTEQMEKPFIIDLEGGITSLKKKDIPYVTVNTTEEVQEAIKMVKDSKEYKTIIFDSFTMLESFLIQEFADKSKTGTPILQDYHKLNINLNKTMLQLRNLRYSGKNIVITMLEMNLQIEQTDQSLITMIYPYLKASKTMLIQKLVGDMDIVAHLELGKERRFLRVKATENIYAKSRIHDSKAIETFNLFKEEEEEK